VKIQYLHRKSEVSILVAQLKSEMIGTGAGYELATTATIHMALFYPFLVVVVM